MYKDIQLNIQPCDFILIGQTKQINRLSTYILTQSCITWTIDQKSRLPACTSYPTLSDLNNKREKFLKQPASESAFLCLLVL